MDAIDPPTQPNPIPRRGILIRMRGFLFCSLSLLTKAVPLWLVGWLVAWLHVAAGINGERKERGERKEGNAMQLLMRKIWDTAEHEHNIFCRFQ